MRFAFFLFLLILSSCGEKKESPATQAIEVTAYTVHPETIPAEFEYVGVAQSSHLVEIRARVEGYLDKIAYKEGEQVKKNALLFQLDPRPFIAALDSSKGLLARYKAELWNAEQAVNRLKPLYEQKAASKRDLDNATASELASLANVDTGKAQVVEAELNLSYTTIRTPITGLASKSSFREGTLITPGPSGLLTTVSVVDPIWVYFTVSEGDILKYRAEEAKGRLKFPADMNFDVKLILSDGTKLSSTGKVNFADPSLQQSTGTLLVRAEFANPENLVLPGQFVRAQLIGAIRPHAILVPQKSVQQGQKGMYVYVIDKNGHADMRTIDPGDWYGNSWWIVESGLQEGEQVVVDGVNKLQPDAPVIIKEIVQGPNSKT